VHCARRGENALSRVRVRAALARCAALPPPQTAPHLRGE
jgi:hypothetical protein